MDDEMKVEMMMVLVPSGEVEGILSRLKTYEERTYIEDFSIELVLHWLTSL